MQAGIGLAYFKQVYVRAVFTGFMTGCITAMTDLVTGHPDRTVTWHTEILFVGAVDGHYPVIPVDYHERLFMGVDQRLEFDRYGDS